MTGPAAHPSHPRVQPLPAEERDDQTRQMLEGLNVGRPRELNIFATLARHPRLLNRWSAFGGTLLLRGEVPPRERELLILRTAWNCQADYEWGQHTAIGRAAGLTDDEIARVAHPEHTAFEGFDGVLITAADELHREAVISDTTWSALAERYNERQLIEVCMLVGQYHLVAFTLNSLGVEREPGVEALPPSSTDNLPK